MPEQLIPEARDHVAIGGRSTAAAALRRGRRQGASTRHDRCRHQRQTPSSQRHGCTTSATRTSCETAGFTHSTGPYTCAGKAGPDPSATLSPIIRGAASSPAFAGFDDRLSEFNFVENAPSDALTVADNTTAPNGMVMTVDERLRDKLKRHGPDTPNARANPERDDYIRAAARRVADRLAAMGQRDPALERVGEQPGDHPLAVG